MATSTTSPRKKAAVPRVLPARSSPSIARDEILKAALKVFARDSFEGASLQTIARQAGITQPLLHYHFGSKENLWKAAADFALADLKTFYQTVSSTTVDLQPVDALRVLCRAFLKFSSECPEHGLIIFNEVRTKGDRFDWLMNTYVVPIHHYLDALIGRAVAAKQVKPIPVEHLTGTIFISLTYFFTMAPMIDMIYKVDVTDPQVIADHSNYAIDILFNGILATGT